MPAAPTFQDWEQAVDVLLSLGRDAPLPVVIDEFPYLCASSPALPSIVQKALGPRRAERSASRARLILCGSAMTFMGRLLSGSAPLRGRAGLDLTVAPFDYRTAARFWGIDDPGLAVQVHAVLGGTPAYRREYVRGDTPRGRDDFDNWVVRSVLDPAGPLLKEARHLLAEEPSLRDKALSHSVLAAVADGNRTRGAIARFVGRRDDALAHPLTVLEDSGLLRRQPDAFRAGRSTLSINEPLVTFHHAIMRPDWARLERPGHAAQVWAGARDRFSSTVLGPHFEELCRDWTLTHAQLPDVVATVAPAVVNDAARRRTWEVDVVAQSSSGRLLAIGEATWGQIVGTAELDRLREIRRLLDGQGRTGEAGQRGEVRCVDVAELYSDGSSSHGTR